MKENTEQMFLTEPLSQVVCVSVNVHVLPMLWLHKSVYTMLLWGPLLNADSHEVNTFWVEDLWSGAIFGG